MKYPRVLVLSNNSFSQTNSNGRTLGNLFNGWPKDCLAQFCLSTDGPNWDVCDNYCCVSDKAVFRSFLTLRSVNYSDLKDFCEKSDSAIKRNRIIRTPFKSLVRHFMWTLGIWKGKTIKKWLNDFNPQIVVIQSGDTAFMHYLALKFAKQFNAKLVFFNTEGIYFMRHVFLPKGKFDFLFFPIYRRIYKRMYSRCMNRAVYAFYLNKMLQQVNDEAFCVPSEVLYNSTSITPSHQKFDTLNPSFVYFGNFGYDRTSALIIIAQTLQAIDEHYHLDVYGRANDIVQNRLEQEKGIKYHGFVSYEKIKEIIANSDILFHAESQDIKHAESLKFGFTTKIADCLASGKSFVLFSSPNIACAQYIIETGAGWHVSNVQELKEAIETIIHKPVERNNKIDISLKIAARNHNIDVLSERFQKRLLSL